MNDSKIYWLWIPLFLFLITYATCTQYLMRKKDSRIEELNEKIAEISSQHTRFIVK